MCSSFVSADRYIKVAGFTELCMGGIAKGRCAGRVEVLKAAKMTLLTRWSNFLELLIALARAVTRYSQYFIVDLSVGGIILPQSK